MSRVFDVRHNLHECKVVRNNDETAQRAVPHVLTYRATVYTKDITACPQKLSAISTEKIGRELTAIFECTRLMVSKDAIQQSGLSGGSCRRSVPVCTLIRI